MQRSMSYRKPVPAYIPSPPSSPPLSPTMHLALSSSSEEPIAAFTPSDGQYIATEQAMSERWSRSASVPQQLPVYKATEPSQEKQVPLITVEAVPTQESDNIHLFQPTTFVSSSPERQHRRKLHQHYRPPTPPLPAHHKKHRHPDHESPRLAHPTVPCSVPEKSYHSRYPYEPSTKAASVLAIQAKSPSFQTEKTYSSFGCSEHSALWAGVTACPESEKKLYELPIHVGRNKKTGKLMTMTTSTDVPKPSWWGRMGTFIRVKFKGLMAVFTC